MNLIKKILAKYTAFIWAALQPLGAWGVFAFAALDSAALGLPLDPIVAGYVYARPRLFWLYAFMAAAGSAAGSIVIYLIGRAGGEVLLHRRMSPAKFEKIRRSFDRHEFLALMLPAMVPPPFPFKLFVLSAAAFGMNLPHFLLAIFAGRLLRFGILAMLTIKFGPQFLAFAGQLFREHFWLVAGAIGMLLIIGYAIRRTRRPVAEVE